MVVAFVTPAAPLVVDCQAEKRALRSTAGAARHPGTGVSSLALVPENEEAAASAAATVAAASKDALACRTAASAHEEHGVCSPTEVTALHAAATSQLSSDIATLPADVTSAASSGDRRLPTSPATSLAPSDASAADLQQAVAAAQEAATARWQQRASPQQQQQQQQSSPPAAAGRLGGRRRDVDVPALIVRLKQRPMTGQVAAWGWDAAATVSAVRRLLPAELFSALWHATEACAVRMMPQDVLEIMDSWLALLRQCPRHFRLSATVVEAMGAYALPAAIKRMSEAQLAQLADTARGIALHRSDADMVPRGVAARGGASARDLMQPFYAADAAEAAWRCHSAARYVSPATVSTLLTSASAWSWRVVRHRDSQALVSLKLATAAALEELLPFSPADLSPAALRKLRTCTSGSLGGGDLSSSLGGSVGGGDRSSVGGSSGNTTPRA